MDRLSKRLLAGTLALAGLCLAAPIAAQAAPPPRILVRLEAPALDDEEDYRSSLEIALSEGPNPASILRSAGVEEALADEGTRRDCSLTLMVRVSQAQGSTRIAWACFSVVDRSTPLASGSFEMPAAAREDLASGFWTEVAQALAGVELALPADTVVVRGPPGTLVSGLGEDFTIPATGRVSVHMKIPSCALWIASRPGSASQSGWAYFAQSGSSLVIPNDRHATWTLDVCARDLSRLELGAGLLLGRRLVLRAELAEFLGEISWEGYSGGSSPQPFFISREEMQAGIGLAYFFMGTEKELRAYASIEGFARISDSGSGVALDTLRPWGFLPCIGGEWGPSLESKLFGEIGAEVYLGEVVRYQLPAVRLGWRLYF